MLSPCRALRALSSILAHCCISRNSLYASAGQLERLIGDMPPFPYIDENTAVALQRLSIDISSMWLAGAARGDPYRWLSYLLTQLLLLIANHCKGISFYSCSKTRTVRLPATIQGRKYCPKQTTTPSIPFVTFVH